MEKLQPLIKHKFWVIAGLALLLPFVGWWLSTSAVAEHIQQRWDKLQNTKVTQAAGQPNQDYIAKIEAVNTVLSDRQSKLDLELYNKQKNLRTWPQYVSKTMDNKHFGDRVDTSTLRIYARNLQDEIVSMLDDIPRYKFHPTTFEESGMVYVESLDVIPPEKKKWPDGNPPTSRVMWETQEDVWLTRSILNAIKKVNNDAGATKITDAPIRQIFLLHFRGGSRPQETAGATDGGAGGMDGGGLEGGDGMGGGGVPGPPGGVVTPGFGNRMAGDDMDGGGGSNANSMLGFDSQIQMNLDAIFGPATVQAAQGAGGDEAGGGGAPVVPGNAGLSGGEGAGSGQQLRRYVDDDPSLPYKTRGFYLEVYMLHDKLPDLQAALVSMPWPTELLMIHQVSDKLDDIIAIREDANDMVLPPAGGQFAPGGETRGGRFNFQNRQRGFGGARGGAPGDGFGRFGGGAANRGGRFGGGLPGMDMEGGRRFPMGNRNPMDMEGGGVDNTRSQELLYYKAMDDFYVTRIGIAGLMTIYRSPEEMATAKAEGADGASMEGQVDPNVPPTDQNATGTPAPPNTETQQSTEPSGTPDQAPENPMPTTEGSEPDPNAAPKEPMDPMQESATSPGEEAKSPPEETPMPTSPGGSPPPTDG